MCVCVCVVGADKRLQYYHHYCERKTAFDEAQLLGELSEQLRAEVSTFMARQTLLAPFFALVSYNFLNVFLLVSSLLSLPSS